MVQEEIRKIQEASDELTPPFSKDEFIKIKTSLDAFDYAVIDQMGLYVLAIRSPEDFPDMVNDLETAAAGLCIDDPERLTHVTIIGNSEVIGVPVPLVVNLLEMKKEEDKKIVVTLREKLNRPLETYLFKDESDPQQLNRFAIKAPGSLSELQDKSLGSVFGGVPVPQDVRVIYIVGEDGFVKLSRREYLEELEEVPEEVSPVAREQPETPAAEVPKQVEVEMENVDIIDHEFTLAGEEEETVTEEEEEEEPATPEITEEEETPEEDEMFDLDAVAQEVAEEEELETAEEEEGEAEEFETVEEEVEGEEEEEEFEAAEEEEEETEEEVEEFETVEEEEEETGEEVEEFEAVEEEEEEEVEEFETVEEEEVAEEVEEFEAAEEEDEEAEELTPPPELEEEEELPEPTAAPEPEEQDHEHVMMKPLPRPSVQTGPEEEEEHEQVTMKPLPRPSVYTDEEEEEMPTDREEADASLGPGEQVLQGAMGRESPGGAEVEEPPMVEVTEEMLQPREIEAPPPLPDALQPLEEEVPDLRHKMPDETEKSKTSQLTKMPMASPLVEEMPATDASEAAEAPQEEPEIVNIKKSVPMSAQEVLDERVKRERLDDLKRSLTLQGFIVSPQEEVIGVDYIASKRYFNDIRVMVGYYKEPALQEALTFERELTDSGAAVGIIVCDNLTTDMKLFTVGKNLKAVAWNDIDTIDSKVRDLLV
jgi:hypothetical protein